MRREDNIVAGLSMGGYGAIKAALTAPETFGACASLSGALDIASFGERADLLPEWRCVFSHELRRAEELRGTKHDIFYLAEKNKDEGKPYPKLYMWCGTEDSLLDHSRRFSKLLSSLSVEHKYEESSGDHSWVFWDEHIKDALSYLLGEA